MITIDHNASWDEQSIKNSSLNGTNSMSYSATVDVEMQYHALSLICHQLFNFLSMSILHFGPNFFIAQMTENPLIQQMTPNPVNSHPLPIELIKGDATRPPTQLKIFRMKLLTATPLLERLGMNLNA
jgi:hypothetical protein